MKNLFQERIGEIATRITQRKLAEQIGVHYNTVNSWILGKSDPKAEDIIKICDILGVSADYLLGIGSPGESPPPALAERPIPYSAAHEPCPNCAAKDLTIAHLAATLEHLTKAKK